VEEYIIGHGWLDWRSYSIIALHGGTIYWFKLFYRNYTQWNGQNTYTSFKLFMQRTYSQISTV